MAQINMTDIGSGLCIAHDTINVDQEFLFSYIEDLKKMEEKNFTYIEENGKKYAVNKSGFKFDIEQTLLAPERFIDVLGAQNGIGVKYEQKKFIDQLEELVYKLLVEYCRFYPEAATVCWWRQHGHIATYSNSQGIGFHCDDQIPYEHGKPVENEYPKHSNVSINIYLNDSVSSIKELNGYNFFGGAINFKYAKFKHHPKTGSAAIYPTNYVGTHSVDPVTHGKRIVYLSSFLYGNPENSSPFDSRIWLPNFQ
jgi:hypothetical protein